MADSTIISLYTKAICVQ